MNKNIEDIYPLSPMQEGILFHTLNAPASGMYFQQLTCVLTGKLNITAFKQAWRSVVNKHSALRTSFEWEGLEKPYQIVHRQVDLPWDERDWRETPPEKQQEQLQNFLKEDRR